MYESYIGLQQNYDLQHPFLICWAIILKSGGHFEFENTRNKYSDIIHVLFDPVCELSVDLILMTQY